MSEVLAEFRALGVPAPQGSKAAFIVPGTGRAGMRETAKGWATWRDAAATAAARYVDEHSACRLPGQDERFAAFPLDGALGLDVEFRLPLPPSRPGWMRLLKRVPKVSAPDLSKLVRALEDALQAGGLITDDARICRLSASKWEVVGWTGAHITLTREEMPTRHTPPPLEQMELIP